MLCKRSESAREQRIALNKSDQQQPHTLHNGKLMVILFYECKFISKTKVCCHYLKKKEKKAFLCRTILLSTFSRCTPLSRQLHSVHSQMPHGYFVASMLEQKPLPCLDNAVFPTVNCAPKQWNSLPSDIRYIKSSHAFKKLTSTITQSNIASNFKFQLLPCHPRPHSPPPPPTLLSYSPSHLLTCLLCDRTHVCVCVCVCVHVCMCMRVCMHAVYNYKDYNSIKYIDIIDLVMCSAHPCC